jgi:aspartate/methionine/tyrosine aminotransferase
MLSMLLGFAINKNINLICDEIYGGSMYDSPNFTSIEKVLYSCKFDKSRVHIIYGASKYLCLIGFIFGIIYSYNDKVLKAAWKTSGFCVVSSHTYHFRIVMLSYTQFIQQYMSLLGSPFKSSLSEPQVDFLPKDRLHQNHLFD